MRDGIFYRGSSHLGQPSLEEPEYQEEPNEAMEIWGKTPEGMGWEPLKESGDSRDATPEPPAYLDPHFILRNRARVQRYLATGEFTWPRAMA